MSFSSSSMIIVIIGSSESMNLIFNLNIFYIKIMNRIVYFLIIRNDYFDEKKKERDARKAETKATTMYSTLSFDHLLLDIIAYLI